MLSSRSIQSSLKLFSIRKNKTDAHRREGNITITYQILMEMKSRDLKVTAYFDDVVILITEKLFRTISDLMDMTKVHVWVRKNGLDLAQARSSLATMLYCLCNH